MHSRLETLLVKAMSSPFLFSVICDQFRFYPHVPPLRIDSPKTLYKPSPPLPALWGRPAPPRISHPFWHWSSFLLFSCLIKEVPSLLDMLLSLLSIDRPPRPICPSRFEDLFWRSPAFFGWGIWYVRLFTRPFYLDVPSCLELAKHDVHFIGDLMF